MKYLITTQKDGNIVIEASSSEEAIKISNERYTTEEDDRAVKAEEYKGMIEPLNSQIL